MLLAIDIGNTETTFGVFEGEKKKATFQMTTAIHRTADEGAVLLLSILKNRGLEASDITEVALCSVVPPLTLIFDDMIKRYFNISPLIVAAGVKTGIRVCMDNPKEVGADRIVVAVAAHHLYGGPVIIVDLGTATTFEIVSKNGDYLGGAIAPGMLSSAEALFQRAAMLPRIDMAPPNKVIGTNTIDAMRSGVVYGYVGLVEGMVQRMQKELGGRVKVVATGGFSGLIAKETRIIDEVNPDLTLIGLRIIYRMNRE
ncbi:MAG: type III pantothenate kinase [Dehalococcoidales bacterium]|jgi:type III pantothenate kinase|nr:type III pantothenate kinase [Dehalococcoidales bacterium]